MNKPTTTAKRAKIVKEYLATKSKGTTLRSLQAKYGVDYRTIGGWVTAARAPKVTSNLKAPVRGTKRSSGIDMTMALKQAMQTLSDTYGLHITVKSKKSGKVKVVLQEMSTHNG